jgi:hypothetical protein
MAKCDIDQVPSRTILNQSWWPIVVANVDKAAWDWLIMIFKIGFIKAAIALFMAGTAVLQPFFEQCKHF